MKKLLLIGLLSTASCFCGSTTSRVIAGTTYTNDFDSGVTYTTRTIGGTDYTNGSNGYCSTGRWIGGTYYSSDNSDN